MVSSESKHKVCFCWNRILANFLESKQIFCFTIIKQFWVVFLNFWLYFINFYSTLLWSCQPWKNAKSCIILSIFWVKCDAIEFNRSLSRWQLPSSLNIINPSDAISQKEWTSKALYKILHYKLKGVCFYSLCSALFLIKLSFITSWFQNRSNSRRVIQYIKPIHIPPITKE